MEAIDGVERCFHLFLSGQLGDLNQAEKIFHSMSKHNIVSYNLLLNLYGLYRQPDKALASYNQMCQKSHRADDKTYVLLLHALSQSPSKIKDSQRLFASIEEGQRGPMLTAAMIAALVQAQLFDQVNALIEKSPKEIIFYCAVRANINASDPPFPYPTAISHEQLAMYDLLMSSMHTYAGVPDRLSTVDELVYNNEALKSILSCSWLQKSDGTIEYFRSNTANLEACEHTERLALASALTEQEHLSSPILIGKNHRTCNECVQHFKERSLASPKRPLHLRDSTRFHSFLNGVCSSDLSS